MLYGAGSREINAVVAFHPGVMKPDEIKRLNVPVQIHHGTADESGGDGKSKVGEDAESVRCISSSFSTSQCGTTLEIAFAQIQGLQIRFTASESCGETGTANGCNRP